LGEILVLYIYHEKVKGKVVPALLTDHHPIGGVEVYIHSFFDLDTRWR
jgi:hypothetical protein